MDEKQIIRVVEDKTEELKEKIRTGEKNRSADLGIGTDVWFLIASFLHINDIVRLLSTCRGANFLQDYEMKNRIEFQWQDNDKRAWFRKHGIKYGRNVTIKNIHKYTIITICFCNSGEFLLASSIDGTLSLWNTNNWSFIKKVACSSGNVRNMRPYEETKILCGTDRGTIELWDLINFCCEWIVYDKDTDSIAVLCMDNSNNVISGSIEGSIKFWDIQSDVPNAHVTHDDDDISPIVAMQLVSSGLIISRFEIL